MTLLVLRHAHAGDRAGWNGDDRLRPLSAHGYAQAEALVATYAELAIDRVLTSPFARCVQSVQPLARARGLSVEEVDELAEGAPPDLVTRALSGVDGTPALVCSHGDVIGALVTGLDHQGVEVGHRLRWQKASTWVLDRARAPCTASYLPPPV